MVIKRSAAQEIQALIADLDAGSEVRRESAAARLAVIGTRAVDRLVAVVAGTASASARAGALHALEAIGDQRALDPAMRSLADADPAVVAAAVDALRRFLRSPYGDTVLDRLIALALDPGAGEPARCAALDALDEMPAAVIAPVSARLRDDPSLRVRQHAAGARPSADPRAELEAAASGLPAKPEIVRALIAEAGAAAPLPTLHRLVTRIREREAAEHRADRRAAWTVARAAAHRALAERDSRVAVYDLRETLEEAASPLPLDFVAALGRVGDASCLDALAAAYAGASPDDDWWKGHLAHAFRAIVAREGLTRRHQAMKRILARCPDLGAGLGRAPQPR